MSCALQWERIYQCHSRMHLVHFKFTCAMTTDSVILFLFIFVSIFFIRSSRILFHSVSFLVFFCLPAYRSVSLRELFSPPLNGFYNFFLIVLTLKLHKINLCTSHKPFSIFFSHSTGKMQLSKCPCTELM